MFLSGTSLYVRKTCVNFNSTNLNHKLPTHRQPTVKIKNVNKRSRIEIVGCNCHNALKRESKSRSLMLAIQILTSWYPDTFIVQSISICNKNALCHCFYELSQWKIFFKINIFILFSVKLLRIFLYFTNHQTLLYFWSSSVVHSIINPVILFFADIQWIERWECQLEKVVLIRVTFRFSELRNNEWCTNRELHNVFARIISNWTTM